MNIFINTIAIKRLVVPWVIVIILIANRVCKQLEEKHKFYFEKRVDLPTKPRVDK